MTAQPHRFTAIRRVFARVPILGRGLFQLRENWKRLRPISALLRLELLVCFVVMPTLTGPIPAWAKDVNVGTITVTTYLKFDNSKVPAFAGRGGVLLDASQNVNLANTCLAGATVHWIQLATFSTPPGPVLPPGVVGPPAPNLGSARFSNYNTFIDPIPKQPQGNGPPANGKTPFYEITANNMKDLESPKKWQTAGTGTVMRDASSVPFNLLNAANTPLEVTFQTLLVATTPLNSKTLLDLGGFQWGYTLTTNPNEAESMKPTALPWADINLNTWQSALNAFYGPPGTYTLAQATCPNGNPVVGFAVANPEPSSVILLGTALLLGMIFYAARARPRRSGA
jgi:hypothetical protein